MKYKGKNLLLDNFRVILSDFSVDVQDVVRSAIMDGVSLEGYLESCRNNPYRLDQIRLGLKEGINKAYFSYESGEIIRGIRGLLSQGVNLAPITKYKSKDLSDKCFLYLIYWCKDGYDVSNLNLSIVPDFLLESYDYGVRSGVDMALFNTGVKYTTNYLDTCLSIATTGSKFDKFVTGDYDIKVLEYMNSLARFSKKYSEIYKILSKVDTVEKIKLYEKILSLGKKLDNRVSNIGEKELGIVVEGLEHDVDLFEKAKNGASFGDLKEAYTEGILVGRRLLSGKLMRSENG